MSWGKGYKSQLLFQFETTYGSDPSPIAAYKLPFNTLTLNQAQPDQMAATIRANRNPVKPFRGNRNVAGNVVVPCDLRAIGFWLKLVLGEPATTGSTSPYTHVFSVSDSLPYAIVEKGFTDIGKYYKYNGVMAESLAIAFGGDGELVATLGLSGKQETYSASAYDAAPTDYSSIATRFENFEAAVTFGTTPAAAAAITILTGFSINITNNIAAAYCIGDSGYKSAQAEGIISVTGTMNALFEDDTYTAFGRAATEKAFVVTLTDGSYSLSFQIAECTLGQNSPDVPGPGGLMQNLDYVAYYDDHADASALKVTLVNNIIDY